MNLSTSYSNSGTVIRSPNCRLAALLLCCWPAVFVLAGCDVAQKQPVMEETVSNSRQQVFVSSLFLKEVVDSLTKNSVDVVFPFEDTTSLEWKPGAEQTRQLQQADLIILNGANFEPWRGQLSLPRSRVVDVSTALADQLMSMDSARSHQHGPRGETDGGETAWATWLDPRLAIAQVKQVGESLKAVLPDQSQQINDHASALIALLTQLDEAVQTRAVQQPSIVVLSNSPQLCYLIRRLGWRMVLLPEDPAILLDEMALREFIQESKSVRALIVPSAKKETSDSLIQALSKAGVAVDELDLLVNHPAGSLPFLERMSANITDIGSDSGASSGH